MTNGGWFMNKYSVPIEIMTDCSIPLLIEPDDKDPELVQMMKDLDPLENNGNYWILYHFSKYLNEAVLNYRLTYCDRETDVNLEYKLELPDKEGYVHRNFVIGEGDQRHWPGTGQA